MKKINATSLLLVLLFCIVPILCILMIHNVSLSDTLTKMEDGSFGNSYSYIAMDNTKKNNYALVQALNRRKVKYALSLETSGNDKETISYLTFNKTFANFPMKEGRFFKPTDFKDENFVAVIGKNIKGVYQKKNQKYIRICGKEYKVLGIIGYEGETVLDNYIYANMFAGNEAEEKNYMIVFFSKENAASVAEECIKEIEGARQLTAVESYADSIMPKIDTYVWFLCIFLCCILCLILISSQWLSQQRKSICIQRLVGASRGKIVLGIIKKYILIAVIALIISSVYCNVWYPAYFSSLLKGYAICVLLLILFMMGNIVIVLHDSIEEAIK